VTLLISAIFLLSKQPEPTLTYTSAALPIQRICDDLSKQAGVKLRVTDDLASEPLVLRFKDVPLREAMDQIAATVKAEWIESKNEILLTRSQKLQQKLEEEAYALRFSRITEGIAETKKRLAAQGLLGATEAQNLVNEFARIQNLDPERLNSMEVRQQNDRLSANMPGSRFAAKIIATLDPEQVANLPEGERIVMSNFPNRMQHPIANWDPAWLDQLVTEMNHIVDAMERQLGRELVAKTALRRIEPRDDLKVLADLREGHIGIRVADSEGRIHAFADLNFLFHDQLDRRAKMEEAERLSRSKPIPLSPLAKELSQRIRSATNRDPYANQPSPAVLQFLKSPETNDPLSQGFSDFMLGYAENEDVNVVAYVPDLVIYWSLIQARTDPVRADVFFESLKVLRTVDLEFDDNWVTVSPIMPLETSLSRTPRNVLGDFVRHVTQQGYLSIDAAANLALQLRDDQIGVASNYLALIFGTQVRAIFSDMDLLRFYGSLSPELKQPSRSKHTLSLNEFGSDQQELLRRMVYRDGYLQDKNARDPEAWEGAMWTVANDPTEAFPEGLPGDSQIVIEFPDMGNYLVKQARPGGGGGYENGTTLDGLAWQYAQMQRTDLFPYMAEQGIMEIWPARMMSFQMGIHPSERWYVDKSLSEQQKTGAGMTLAQFLDSLDSDRRAIFDEEVRKANEYFKTAPADFFETGVRPPRPPQ
jgi:hypothetical protein